MPPKKKKKKTKAPQRKSTAKPRKKRTAAKPKRTAKAKTAKKSAKSKKSARQRRIDFNNLRTFPRVPIRLKIDYFKDPGVFLYDYSRNLGRGGLFIETESPMPPGTDLHLLFTLPKQERPIEVTGRVVWTHRRQDHDEFRGVPGMGIQFQNPEGENKDALDRFFREIDYDNLSF